MKKVILAPDSFKGTMSSTQICTIMERVIKNRYPDCEILKIPVADGGEGTVECFLTAIGGEKIEVNVKGPYFEDIKSFYGILKDGKTAIIEMAAAAGLPLVKDKNNPAITTTYGVGQLILDAAQHGVSNIIIGLGGSCTNDGGCGAAAATGVKFYDNIGNEFIPIGQTLNKISKIDISKLNPLLKEINISIMCDINNPLYGVNGAAFIFAPQKGADTEMVKVLDENLIFFANAVKNNLNIDICNVSGAGAAGGMGAGMIAFFSASLNSGIETVLDLTDFDSKLKNCDMIFTGEGRIDGQSIHGKVISGIAKRASAKSIPVCAVVGDIGDNIEPIYELGVTAVFSINRKAISFELAKTRSAFDLEMTFDNIIRFLSKVSKFHS